MSKMKNMAKNEIVLHNPYSNTLLGHMCPLLARICVYLWKYEGVEKAWLFPIKSLEEGSKLLPRNIISFCHKKIKLVGNTRI